LEKTPEFFEVRGKKHKKKANGDLVPMALSKKRNSSKFEER
jgi:hypothetical protein